MRVTVVGAGIFGSIAAVELARAGHSVELVERHGQLMAGASRCNQGRLHFGYHYPRSRGTAEVTRRCAPQFADRFRCAIDWSHDHYYAIAEQESLTSTEDYLDFLGSVGLEYRQVDGFPATALAIEVSEAIVDLDRLRMLLLEEIAEAGVKVSYGRELERQERIPGDLIVDATYGRWSHRQLQREICEVVIVRLPVEQRRTSLVVMDGPFISLDPISGTDLHLLYDVENSVRRRVIGCEIGETPFDRWLDRGPIELNGSPKVNRMLVKAARFGFDNLEYLSSMYTVRSVLPGVEATDERPTLVERCGASVSILSGKIDTALEAARQVVEFAAG